MKKRCEIFARLADVLSIVYFQAMAPKQPNSGLFVGLNKGHILTKKELAPRPSDRKGVKILTFPDPLCCFVCVFRDVQQFMCIVAC